MYIVITLDMVKILTYIPTSLDISYVGGESTFPEYFDITNSPYTSYRNVVHVLCR